MPVTAPVWVTFKVFDKSVVEAEVAVKTLVASAAVPNPSLANWGVEEVAMSWGVDRVMVPAPLVTVTWLVVPVSKARTGVAPVEPMTSWPLVMDPSKEGTPVELVTNTPLFAVAKPPMTLVEDEYNNWLTVVVAG